MPCSAHLSTLDLMQAYTQRVHRVMDHVRRHFADDLSLTALAQIAHFSPYHFHRIFKTHTGETITGFIQRVRLERACYLMMAAPSRQLGSIAHEVGFCAQSDFSRVFKQRYGMAPSRWDRKTRLTTTGIDNYAQAVQAARAEGPPPVARIVDHPACRLAYVRMQMPFMDGTLAIGYERLTQWLDARGIDWRTQALMGLSWDNFETTPLGQVRFDLGFTVPAHIEAADDIGIHTFEALRAVDVTCDGPLSRIAVAWDYLYNEWLPNSRFEPADMPGIKRFRTLPGNPSKPRCSMDRPSGGAVPRSACLSAVARKPMTGPSSLSGSWDTWHVDCSIAIRPLRP